MVKQRIRAGSPSVRPWPNCIFSSLTRCATMPATAEESIPPDRYRPIGTSARRRTRTASTSFSRTSWIMTATEASSSGPPWPPWHLAAFLEYCASQYGRVHSSVSAVAGPISIQCPGASFRTPANMVLSSASHRDVAMLSTSHAGVQPRPRNAFASAANRTLSCCTVQKSGLMPYLSLAAMIFREGGRSSTITNENSPRRCWKSPGAPWML